jgi:hypothetical protein
MLLRDFIRRSAVMRTVMCGVCFLLSVAVCSAAGPFDGKWTAHVMRPAPAGPQDLTITLKTDEGKVTGSIAIQGGGESPIEWGIVKGDLIVFKLKMPFQDRTETFVYLGRLEGNQIAFGRRPENLSLGRLVEFTGVRGK